MESLVIHVRNTYSNKSSASLLADGRKKMFEREKKNVHPTKLTLQLNKQHTKYLKFSQRFERAIIIILITGCAIIFSLFEASMNYSRIALYSY